jgi:hypothetical protein
MTQGACEGLENFLNKVMKEEEDSAPATRHVSYIASPQTGMALLRQCQSSEIAHHNTISERI